MMTTKNTGGPAFPVFPDTGGGHAAAFQGMTLRDYFAAKAMQGMIGGNWPVSQTDQDHIAEFAYDVADAMLEERKSD